MRYFQGKGKGVKCTEAWRAVKDLDAWAGGFDGRVADKSHVRVVFPFKASAIAMPASGPSLLLPRLRKRRWTDGKGKGSELACCGAVRHGRVGSMAG